MQGPKSGILAPVSASCRAVLDAVGSALRVHVCNRWSRCPVRVVAMLCCSLRCYVRCCVLNKYFLCVASGMYLDPVTGMWVGNEDDFDQWYSFGSASESERTCA